jgi:hypothetical protein
MFDLKLYILDFLKSEGFEEYLPLSNNFGIYKGYTAYGTKAKCTISIREEDAKTDSNHGYTKGILHLYFTDTITGGAGGCMNANAEFALGYCVYRSLDDENNTCLTKGLLVDSTSDKRYRPLLNRLRAKLIGDELISWGDI